MSEITRNLPNLRCAGGAAPHLLSLDHHRSRLFARSKLLPTLRTLDLRFGCFGDDSIDALLRDARFFEHLEHVRIEGDVGAKAQRALAKRLPNLAFERIVGDERYVSVSE